MKVYLADKYSFVKKTANSILWLTLLGIIIAIMLLILARFKPVFEEKAVALAKSRAADIINSAIIEVFSGIDSDDFVDIIETDTGKITSVSVDSVSINKLKAGISDAVLRKTEENEDCYVHIPIGSLTRYPVLQGIGYRIPVKVSLDGVSRTDFDEEFINAGINQVKNRIYIIVTARISIVSSFMSINEEVSTHVPVTETIIIGDVPEYYGDRLGVLGR